MNRDNTRLVFGLKVKQLRQAKQLSFSDLSAATGVSVSYLNEIEKGKKYPKADKIHALADALDVDFDELVSTKLPARLQPVSDLLESRFLNDLPLDLFGIEAGKVIEIIANSPAEVGAFISTLTEMARNYALQEENFYFSSLRSYQELHQNYFEEIENAVDKFVEEHKLLEKNTTVFTLSNVLKQAFGYKIDRESLATYPKLKSLRSVFVKEKKRLLINQGLTESQEIFLLAKEIGFNVLKIKDRPATSTLLDGNSFEKVLTNFKAGYFAGALIVNQERLISDLSSFFSKKKWDPVAFVNIMHHYKASPEMFLSRLTNLLPRFFNLHQLFFLRFKNQPGVDHFDLTKELHLQGAHHPHGNGLQEHYCRRWITIRLLKELHQIQESGQYTGPIVGVQRSKFIGTNDEYLCFSLARPGYPTPETNISLTLGILIDEQVKSKVHFWGDPNIPMHEVNNTCQRCALENCDDRVAPRSIVEQKSEKRTLQAELEMLSKKIAAN
ncbi:MAG: XRE family transcriptional regulator [Bacteroidota bacterium]